MKKNIKYLIVLILVFCLTPMSFALEGDSISDYETATYRFSEGNLMDFKTRNMLSEMTEEERVIWVEKNIEPVYYGEYEIGKMSRGEWIETRTRKDALYKDENLRDPICQIETRVKFLVNDTLTEVIDANTSYFETRSFVPHLVIQSSATPIVRNSPYNIAKTYRLEAVGFPYGYMSISQQYNFYGNGMYAVRVY